MFRYMGERLSVEGHDVEPQTIRSTVPMPGILEKSESLLGLGFRATGFGV